MDMLPDVALFRVMDKLDNFTDRATLSKVDNRAHHYLTTNIRNINDAATFIQKWWKRMKNGGRDYGLEDVKFTAESTYDDNQRCRLLYQAQWMEKNCNPRFNPTYHTPFPRLVKVVTRKYMIENNGHVLTFEGRHTPHENKFSPHGQFDIIGVDLFCDVISSGGDGVQVHLMNPYAKFRVLKTDVMSYTYRGGMRLVDGFKTIPRYVRFTFVVIPRAFYCPFENSRYCNYSLPFHTFSPCPVLYNKNLTFDDFVKNRFDHEDVLNLDTSKWNTLCSTSKYSQFRADMIKHEREIFSTEHRSEILKKYFDDKYESFLGERGQMKSEFGENDSDDPLNYDIHCKYLRRMMEGLWTDKMYETKTNRNRRVVVEELVDCSPGHIEYAIQTRKMIRNLLKSCPNFKIPYTEIRLEKVVLLISEATDYSMNIFKYGFPGVLETDAVIKSVLYQMFIALHAFQSKYGVVYNNLDETCFLFKRVRRGGWIQYTIKTDLFTETFNVQNTGIIVLMCTDGVRSAVSYHPDYSPSTCARCAVDSNLRVSPVTSETDGVDLRDFVRFPAVVFFDNIMDVIKLFKGGMLGAPIVCIEKGYQFQMVMSDELRDRVDSHYSDTFDATNVTHVLAAQMLKSLYVEEKPPSDRVIARYTI